MSLRGPGPGSPIVTKMRDHALKMLDHHALITMRDHIIINEMRDLALNKLSDHALDTTIHSHSMRMPILDKTLRRTVHITMQGPLGLVIGGPDGTKAPVNFSILFFFFCCM